jgi:hypothetical protein
MIRYWNYDPGLIRLLRYKSQHLRAGQKEYRDLEATLISGDQRLDMTRLVFETRWTTLFG